MSVTIRDERIFWMEKLRALALLILLFSFRTHNMAKRHGMVWLVGFGLAGLGFNVMLC